MTRCNMPTYVSLRKACPTPWVALGDIGAFRSFCVRNGVEIKSCVDGESGGYHVRYRGGWGHLLWNRASGRYSADRRLSGIVKRFNKGYTSGIKETA